MTMNIPFQFAVIFERNGRVIVMKMIRNYIDYEVPPEGGDVVGEAGSVANGGTNCVVE
jgi:hypothetical protein